MSKITALTLSILVVAQLGAFWLITSSQKLSNFNDSQLANLAERIEELRVLIQNKNADSAKNYSTDFQRTGNDKIKIDYQQLAQALQPFIVSQLAVKREELGQQEPVQDHRAASIDNSAFSEQPQHENHQKVMALLDNAIISGDINTNDAFFINTILSTASAEQSRLYSEKIHEAIYESGIDPRKFAPPEFMQYPD